MDHVSFVVRPGEILGYLGPNAAGKSTTVKMLTGLIEPTSGSISFRGQDMHKDLKAFQRHIGYVPEEPHLYPHLSGREYLQLIGRLRGMPRGVLEPKMDELLHLTGLWEDRHILWTRFAASRHPLHASKSRTSNVALSQRSP